MADPTLRRQREFKSCMLGAGDTDIGRSEQDIHSGPRRPSVDGGYDGFPNTRVMVAETPIDSGSLAMHGPGQRPENPLRAQIFAFFLSDVRALSEVMTAAEMPVTGPCQNCATNVTIF